MTPQERALESLRSILASAPQLRDEPIDAETLAVLTAQNAGVEPKPIVPPVLTAKEHLTLHNMGVCWSGDYRG